MAQSNDINFTNEIYQIHIIICEDLNTYRIIFKHNQNKNICSVIDATYNNYLMIIDAFINSKDLLYLGN